MPEHNSVAERLNCMLVERVCVMIHASGLPKNLWGEAIMHATWLKNCSSTRHLGTKMPYETLLPEETKPLEYTSLGLPRQSSR